MRISDLLSLSFENLRRRKGRTALTIIGVVVGTCSIVVMVSLGIAMNVGFEEMISQWGDLTQIQVYNWSGNTEVPKLDDEMVKTLDALEHVKVATPALPPAVSQRPAICRQERPVSGLSRDHRHLPAGRAGAGV